MSRAEGRAAEFFGTSVAIDPTYLFVAATQEGEPGQPPDGHGAVYVYSAGALAFRQRLQPTALLAGDVFGSSIALSGDTALIGAYNDDTRGSNAGAAYIYRRAGAVWSLVSKVVPGDVGAGDWFGRFSSMCDDVIIIGAPFNDLPASNAGAAYWYNRDASGVWDLIGRMPVPSVAADSNFGTAVAVSENGEWAAVGGPGWNVGTILRTGAVDIFRREPPGSPGVRPWRHFQRLLGRLGAGDAFGQSVALRGGWLAVGANESDGPGFVRVYQFDGDRWILNSDLSAPGGVPSGFGRTLDLDAGNLAVGSAHSSAANGQVHLYVTRTGECEWVYAQSLTISGADSRSPSLSISKNRLVVGAERRPTPGLFSGAVDLFGGPSDVIEETGVIPVPGAPSAMLSYRMSAVKAGDRTAQLRLSVRNDGSGPIDCSVCAMLNLMVGLEDIKSYQLSYRGGVWSCALGATMAMVPNYHFGCERIQGLPAGCTKELFVGSKGLGRFSRSFTADQLGAVYFDVLAAGEITISGPGSCLPVVGTNKWLYPGKGDTRSWINVWAGGAPFYRLIPAPASSTLSWMSGNWITMARPAEYPAVVRGILSRAMAGSAVKLSIDGGLLWSGIVAEDASRGECAGADLLIEADIVIPPDQQSMLKLVVDPPTGPCGTPVDGSVMRFDADVVARAGAPVYAPGEVMYKVDLTFVRDETPPQVTSALTEPAGPVVDVTVVGFDDLTSVASATFVYLSEGEPVAIGIYPDIDQPVAGATVFRSPVTGLPLREVIDYHIELRDDVGNVAVGPAQTVRIACPADYTHDGRVDVDDYAEFLDRFGRDDQRTDYTRDGLVDYSDYLEFLNWYAEPC